MNVGESLFRASDEGLCSRADASLRQTVALGCLAGAGRKIMTVREHRVKFSELQTSESSSVLVTPVDTVDAVNKQSRCKVT